MINLFISFIPTTLEELCKSVDLQNIEIND